MRSNKEIYTIIGNLGYIKIVNLYEKDFRAFLWSLFLWSAENDADTKPAPPKSFKPNMPLLPPPVFCYDMGIRYLIPNNETDHQETGKRIQETCG